MIKRTRIAKSHRIAEQLRRDFYCSEMQRGMPAISANELAKQYNVSVPTAHNVLNMLVRDGLLYRVKGSGTFFNKDNAGRKIQIGIADQTVSKEFLSDDINRILDCHFNCAAEFFRNHDCRVRIVPYSDLMLKDSLKDLDALLISCLYLDKITVPFLQKLKIPVVVYRYSNQPSPEFSHLYYDLNSGIKEALTCLHPSKTDKFIIVAEESPSALYASDCWCRQLALCGIEENNLSIHTTPVSERERFCYRLVRTRQKEFKDAVILTANDEIAVNLLNALDLEEFRRGKDYRLIGIGNRADYGSEMAQKLQLASVDTPIRQMAEEGAKLLLYALNNNSNSKFSVGIPTHFISRESAGVL